VTRDQLRGVIIDALKSVAPEVDPAALRDDAPLRDQVDIDSMDALRFFVALHQQLGVDIPETDYAKLGSVNAIVSYLSSTLHR
jgi:acyl carrier protein